MKDTIRNTTQEDNVKLIRIQEYYPSNKVNSSSTKVVQNDEIQPMLLTSLSGVGQIFLLISRFFPTDHHKILFSKVRTYETFQIDTKYNDLTTQTRKMETYMLESIGIMNKMYSRIDHEKDDIIYYLGSKISVQMHNSGDENFSISLPGRIPENFKIPLRFRRNFFLTRLPLFS